MEGRYSATDHWRIADWIEGTSIKSPKAAREEASTVAAGDYDGPYRWPITFRRQKFRFTWQVAWGEAGNSHEGSEAQEQYDQVLSESKP